MKIETPAQEAKRHYRETVADIENRLDVAYSDPALTVEQRKVQIEALRQEKAAAKTAYDDTKAKAAKA